MSVSLGRQFRIVVLVAALLGLLLIPSSFAVSAAGPVVTSCADSGAGTLRDSIATAVSGDTITFNQNCTILLTTGPLIVGTNLTIDGTGHTVVIDGGCPSGCFIVGDPFSGSRIVTVNSGVTAAIRSLTLQHGSAGGGGGIGNDGTLTVVNSVIVNNRSVDTFSAGGGIYNGGTLMLVDSTVSGNDSSANGGSIVAAGDGGGIFNYGTLIVMNSTISGNSAGSGARDGGGAGGGIYNYSGGMLTVTGSTISGNRADGNYGLGGGVYNDRRASLTATNSTFSGNSASAFDTASGAQGGGVYSTGTLTITNSTFSGNSASTRVGAGPGGGLVSNGGALLTNTIVATSTGGDLSGTFAGNNNLIDDATINTLGGSHNLNTPALLGTLSSNGGPTQTIPLLSGSPAIDAGDPLVCAAPPVNGIDQRGFLRQVSRCSIGAYEAHPGQRDPLPQPKPPSGATGTPSPLPTTHPPGTTGGPIPNPLPASRP